MSEIREKLLFIKKCFSWAEGHGELMDQALALLPPEGETRDDESDTWDLVTWLQVQARASALPYKTCKRLNDAAEEILKLRAEPAPSSDKTLRDIAEGLVAIDWCVGYALTNEQHIELDRIRSNAAALLASSPAPSEVKS